MTPPPDSTVVVAGHMAQSAGYYFQEWWPILVAPVLPYLKSLVTDIHTIADSLAKLASKIGGEEIDIKPVK